MSISPAPQSLERLIQVYDHALDAGLCEKLIASFHALSRFQRANGRGQRAGLDDSSWTELDISALSDLPFRAMLLQNMHAHLQRYLQTAGLTVPIPATENISELIIKRYRAGRLIDLPHSSRQIEQLRLVFRSAKPGQFAIERVALYPVAVGRRR